MAIADDSSNPLFTLFHRYNKLVRRGLVKSLNCKTCDTPLVTSVDAEGELILKCFSCASKTRPGVATIGNVRAVVKEHFSE